MNNNNNTVEEVEIVQIDLKAMQSMQESGVGGSHHYTVTSTDLDEHCYDLPPPSQEYHQDPTQTHHHQSTGTAATPEFLQSIMELITNKLTSFENKLTMCLQTQATANKLNNQRFSSIERQLELIRRSIHASSSLSRSSNSIKPVIDRVKKEPSQSTYNFWNEDDDSNNDDGHLQTKPSNGQLDDDGDDDDPDYSYGGHDNDHCQDDDDDNDLKHPTSASHIHKRSSSSRASKPKRVRIKPKKVKNESQAAHEDDVEAVEYTCPSCPETFQVQRLYVSHYYNSHIASTRINPLKCPLCKHISPTPDSHDAHVAQDHPNSEETIGMLIAEAQTHQDGHRTAAQKLMSTACRLCDQDFATKGEFYKHCNASHKSLLKPFKCKSCPEEYYLASKLAEHYTAKHEVALEGDGGGTEAGGGGLGLKSNIAARTCSTCSKIFSRSSDLSRHMKLHSGITYDCTYCKKRFTRKDSLLDHQALICKAIPDGQRPEKSVRAARARYNQKLKEAEEAVKDEKVPSVYPCSVPSCSQTFKNKTRLENHVLSFHGHKPYQCTLCAKYFTKESHLIEHSLGVHEKATRYLCTECGKAFFRRRSYIAHVEKYCKIEQEKRNKDPSYLAYSCSECNGRFSRPNALRRHKLLHSGVKPYECDICGRTFRRRYVMLKHRTTSHETKEEQ